MILSQCQTPTGQGFALYKVICRARARQISFSEPSSHKYRPQAQVHLNLRSCFSTAGSGMLYSRPVSLCNKSPQAQTLRLHGKFAPLLCSESDSFFRSKSNFQVSQHRFLKNLVGDWESGKAGEGTEAMASGLEWPSDWETQIEEKLLHLEEIDINLFRASSEQLFKPRNSRAIYGGQIVGQALVAAGKTVEPEYHIHSTHCYFLRPGNPSRDVLYHVEKTRDGKSFQSRTVKAVQQGQPIFTCQTSYQADEDSGVHHQHTMPEVPPADAIPSIHDMVDSLAKRGKLTPQVVDFAKRLQPDMLPVEMKPVVPSPRQWFDGKPKDPRALIWVRAKGKIGDQNNLHRAVAAYFSDWLLLGTALYPTPTFRPSHMASIDHSMWFHRHFRADEWMLFDVEVTQAAHSRALCQGRLWCSDGTLAVSVQQEGLLRGQL